MMPMVLVMVAMVVVVAVVMMVVVVVMVPGHGMKILKNPAMSRRRLC